MTGSPRLRHFLVGTLLALTPQPSAADMVNSVNKVRAHGCPGRHGGLISLRETRQLDAVAQQLSRGMDLGRAQQAAGYHAASMATVEMSGVPESDFERVLVQKFCSAATEPEFREIGVYQQGGNVWIALAQPFTPPPTRDAAAVARRVLELTNEARAHARRCGWTSYAAVPPLTLNTALDRAALEHSRDMANHNYFDHTGSDASSPADRITRTGYRWGIVGENLASGMTTPEDAVAGWVKSPHHCANLMTARFTEMGLAFAVNPSGSNIYWTQTFGTAR
jgi:uncharacterized protein YkwD